MIFASRTNYPKMKSFSKSGSGLVPIYVKAYDEDGEPYLEKHGDRNVYDIIQAHYDDTRISSIVSRFESGDNSVLGKIQGFYADLTQQASNLQDAQNAMIKVQAFYDRMPNDVKRKFSTLNQFIKSLGTDELKQMIMPKKAVKSDDFPATNQTVKETNANASAE